MRINHKVLSIPPYVSTSWKNISSLQSKKDNEQHSLLVYLQDGSCILIPNLEEVVVQAIFAAHAKYMELDKVSAQTSDIKKQPAPFQDSNSGIKFFEIENISSMLCHNEQEKNA